MRRFILMAVLIASWMIGPVMAAPRVPVVVPAGSFTILCYHETLDDVRDYPDPYAVDSAALVSQFDWLLGNGYTPVSLDQIIQARQGGKPLPPKAVLLTFDDAYMSFYTRVYPLLREFRFPAVLGVVGKWIDAPPGSIMLYGEKGTVPNATFPSWAQLKEMADSGLVEMASHSYDLHRGIVANPQGNLQPAGTARAYTGNLYEEDASWRERVLDDLAKNADLIARNTGQRPRAMVWPYGSYNDDLVQMAAKLGMPITLTLNDGINSPEVPLAQLRRTLIQHNPTLAEFASEVIGTPYPDPMRVVQVDLDDVYNSDPIKQESNLSILLERIKALKPSHIYLRASTDSNGDNIADATYFPRHLPVRADLFNRVAWQLATRSDVKVYAVLPVTAFNLQESRVIEIYEDLARYANFDGLVFDDGAHSTDANADSVKFTQLLAARASVFRAPLKTVRTLYVEPPSGDTATSQDMQKFSALADGYDFVALIPPQASGTREKSVDDWALALMTRLGIKPGNAHSSNTNSKAVFLLRNPSNGKVLAREMRALQLRGALNFGYLHDDFLHNNPPLAETAPAMSLRIHPR